MLKKVLMILVLAVLVPHAFALDPVIDIDVPMNHSSTEGFYIYPESTTFETGQNISFFNDDKNRRPFTVISEEGVFENGTSNEAYMSFRQRTRFVLNEPGTYNFYLKERPIIKIHLTAVGDGSSGTGQDADRQGDTQDREEPDYFKGMGGIPGFGAAAASLVLTIAFLIVRNRR